jgi:dTDP-4-dehydrorhamnose reductase
MKVALTGTGGQLGGAFDRHLRRAGFEFKSFNKSEWDICSKQHAEEWLKDQDFDVLINCAAYTDVEKAQTSSSACFKVNAEGTKTLAEACAKTGTKLVHFSTDYVFDGMKGSPYQEEDPAKPINIYGESKLLGEAHIKDADCPYFIFRISWLFGGKNAGFLAKVRQWMKHTTSLRITDDEISNPTFCHHVPEAVFTVIKQAKTRSIFHLANQGCCSRYEWVKYFVETCLKQSASIQRTTSETFKTLATRPKNSSLNIEKVSALLKNPMPSWQEATSQYALQGDIS